MKIEVRQLRLKLADVPLQAGETMAIYGPRCLAGTRFEGYPIQRVSIVAESAGGAIQPADVVLDIVNAVGSRPAGATETDIATLQQNLLAARDQGRQVAIQAGTSTEGVYHFSAKIAPAGGFPAEQISEPTEEEVIK